MFICLLLSFPSAFSLTFSERFSFSCQKLRGKLDKKMVKTASSPSSSPVTITVSSGGKGGGIRSMGLTSPVPRASVSNNPNSPLSSRGNRRASCGGGKYSSMSKDETTTEEVNTEFVSYTVHIPPTPDHQPMSVSQTSLSGDGNNARKSERSFISGTLFTGGYNSVTRGHVIECSMDGTEPVKSGLICGMKGCDEKAIRGTKSRGICECGFKICQDCYLDCIGSGGGRCPGCKETYKDISDDDEEDDGDDEPGSEAEDQALPLPSDFKLDKRLSVVKSFKAQNHQPPEFDHSRWLFETKGTYGYGNAVWPKDGYGVGSGANGFEHPPDFGERSRRPLTRKVAISAAILSPYR